MCGEDVVPCCGCGGSLGSTFGTYVYFKFGLGMLGKLVMILILMLSAGQALLEADREAA